MTNLWDESKLRRSKAFVISMGATVILTTVISIVTYAGNYNINAQMMGDHGGRVGNMTSGVKDHQQKMVINGTISLEQTIFEAINSKLIHP
jgi:hypothetical protein